MKFTNRQQNPRKRNADTKNFFQKSIMNNHHSSMRSPEVLKYHFQFLGQIDDPQQDQQLYSMVSGYEFQQIMHKGPPPHPTLH